MAVRAAQAVLDRVVPRRGALSVGIGADQSGTTPAEVIRARLTALREAQQAPPGQPPALPWDGEPQEGDVLDGPAVIDGSEDDGDW